MSVEFQLGTGTILLISIRLHQCQLYAATPTGLQSYSPELDRVSGPTLGMGPQLIPTLKGLKPVCG